ncbi:hypothetical protein CDV36_001287 [Fusarium kuroshium]|uniref:SCP domain-containing protein n=2 Tax=Fusarium solani species complex TaxID=232080 RepID=A0A428QNA6_9HYPO|nr:hypothetical protein CDV36_001287 [Fusarium kuroshium]RSL66769.1 hypothetical protein CEP54_003620 [Fusarium duplospermum]
MKFIPTLASLALFLFATLVSANDDLVLAINTINQARQAKGINPLGWSPDLAAYAQYWANQMGAGAQPFSHAPPELRPLQGENIFQQTATQCDAVHDTPLQNAVKAWLSQERLYTGQPISDGKEPWLHWSQCMWSQTTHIACARAYSVSEPCRVFDVCRFYPEGNIIGQTPF